LTRILSGNRTLGLTVVLTLAIVLLPLPASLAQSQHAVQDEGSYRISVDVGLVVLPATVQNRRGLQVSDLRAEDFEVFEDRVAQRIRLFRHEDTPVTVGLVIDHSGSMGPKLSEVIHGARTFVRLSNLDDQMFVVNFNETVTLGLGAAIKFTSSSEELERAIWRAPATGETALYDAILKGLARLQSGGRERKALVVISDGADNASSHKLAEVLRIAERSNAIIYAVGLFAPDDRDANPGVLQRVAQTTGGEAFFPKKIDEVVTICERIARDIRNQYTIGYVSSNPKRDGVYRSIRLTAQTAAGSKLFVRTRPGYIAAPLSGPEYEDGK